MARLKRMQYNIVTLLGKT